MIFDTLRPEILATNRFSVYCNEREFYDRQGYLFIANYLDQDEVKLIIEELDGLKKSKLKSPGLKPPPFRALGSPEVLAALRESCFGADVFGTPGCVDTIGHGLHYIEGSSFESFIHSAKLKEVLHSITDIKIPTVVQTKAVLKPAKTGIRVPTHTDDQYIYTKPLSGLAMWVALDDASKVNGCVEVVPCSHRKFQSGQKFADDGSAKISWVAPNVSEDEKDLIPFPYKPEDIQALNWKPIEAQSGDCLIMHPKLLHSSAPNTSAFARRALTIHLVDGACAWDERNWIVPHKELGFSRGIV